MRWVTYRLGRNDVAAFSLPPPSRRRDSSLGRADPIVPSIWGTWLLPRSVSIPGSNRGFREGEESGEALERLEGKGRIPACPSGSERVGGAGGGVVRCETRGRGTRSVSRWPRVAVTPCVCLPCNTGSCGRGERPPAVPGRRTSECPRNAVSGRPRGCASLLTWPTGCRALRSVRTRCGGRTPAA